MFQKYSTLCELTIVPLCYLASAALVFFIVACIFNASFFAGMIYSIVGFFPIYVIVKLADLLILIIYPGHTNWRSGPPTHVPGTLTSEQMFDTNMLRLQGKHKEANDLASQYRQQNALEEIARNIKKDD